MMEGLQAHLRANGVYLLPALVGRQGMQPAKWPDTSQESSVKHKSADTACMMSFLHVAGALPRWPWRAYQHGPVSLNSSAAARSLVSSSPYNLPPQSQTRSVPTYDSQGCSSLFPVYVESKLTQSHFLGTILEWPAGFARREPIPTLINVAIWRPPCDRTDN